MKLILPEEPSELIGPGSRRHEYADILGTSKRATLKGNRGIQPNGTRSLGPAESVAILTAEIQGADIFQIVAKMYGKK